jgi:hypothetical protein
MVAWPLKGKECIKEVAKARDRVGTCLTRTPALLSRILAELVDPDKMDHELDDQEVSRTL